MGVQYDGDSVERVLVAQIVHGVRDVHRDTSVGMATEAHFCVVGGEPLTIRTIQSNGSESSGLLPAFTSGRASNSLRRLTDVPGVHKHARPPETFSHCVPFVTGVEGPLTRDKPFGIIVQPNFHDYVVYGLQRRAGLSPPCDPIKGPRTLRPLSKSWTTDHEFLQGLQREFRVKGPP